MLVHHFKVSSSVRYIAERHALGQGGQIPQGYRDREARVEGRVQSSEVIARWLRPAAMPAVAKPQTRP
jgi:hypothetical protein